MWGDVTDSTVSLSHYALTYREDVKLLFDGPLFNLAIDAEEGREARPRDMDSASKVAS